LERAIEKGEDKGSSKQHARHCVPAAKNRFLVEGNIDSALKASTERLTLIFQTYVISMRGEVQTVSVPQ